MKNFWRIGIWIPLFLIAFLLLIIGILIFTVWHSKKELQRTISDLESRGESFDLKNFAPPPVQTISNGAPQLAQAWKGICAIPELRTALHTALNQPKDRTSVLPIRHLQPQTPHGTEWKELHALLEDAGSLGLELQAAALTPELGIDVVYSDGKSPLILGGFQDTISICSFFGQSAIVDLQRANPAGALKNIRAILNISKMTAKHPFSLFQNMSWSKMNIASSASWEFLQSPYPNEDQLEELQSAWQSLAPAASLSIMLRAERAYVAELFLQPSSVQSRHFRETFAEMPEGLLENKFLYELYYLIRFLTWNTFYRYADQNESIQNIQKLIDTSDSALSLKYWGEFQRELHTQTANRAHMAPPAL